MYLPDNEDRQWLSPPATDTLGLGAITTLDNEDTEDEGTPPRTPIGFQPPLPQGLMKFSRPKVF